MLHHALHDTSPIDWKTLLYDVLKDFDIKHLAYVPDAGHSTCSKQTVM